MKVGGYLLAGYFHLLLKNLAKPHWGVLFFLLLSGASILILQGYAEITLAVMIPLALLVISILAAFFVVPRFRTDAPLLIFHLALVVLVILFAISRLTYFDATVSLNQGERFTGELVTEVKGPLHSGDMGRVRFSNQGFYEQGSSRGVQYKRTQNRLAWWDQSGNRQEAIIGDDRPLMIGHYRIYTSRYRGYTLQFVWSPSQGGQQIGDVQLDPAVSGEFAPANSWDLPNGQTVWTMLEVKSAEPLTNSDVVVNNLDAEQGQIAVILRINEQRYRLLPGESAALTGGRLTYRKLQSWMGYRIVYDLTNPWIIATILLAVCSLCWFYYRRILSGTYLDSDV